MKRESLHSLYRATMDGLTSSADLRIEELRRRWVVCDLPESKVAAEDLVELAGGDEAWARHAFDDFVRNGFVEHNYHHFLWRDAARKAVAASLTLLASIESAVMLRVQEIDLAKVETELDYQHGQILRAADGGSALPVTLALQRYFTTLVVSIGSLELMSRYAAINKASVCYGWAEHLRPGDIDDLGDWLVLLPEVIAGGGGRKAAHLCQAIKCLPFGAVLPELAAA